MGREELPSQPEPNLLPEFNTVEEFMAHAEQADARLEETALRLLGNTAASDKTARGRVMKLVDALRKDPSQSYYTDIPLMDLRGERERPLDQPERLYAIAVNEKVLEALYEEAEVDYRRRKLEDSQIHGHTMREIIYPTDKGYAFVEEWQYDYEAEPDTAVPNRLNVYVYTWRDGQLAGEHYLSPTESEVKA